MTRALAPLVLVVYAAAAWAGPTEDAAREASRKGTAAYNLGSYEEAARQYEAAYRLVQDPILLFNLGQSWRLGGQPDKALTAYRAYLRTAPPDAPNRDSVQRRIHDLESTVATTRPGQPAPTLASPPMPAPPAETSAPAVAVTMVPADRPPVYRRWWFWAGAGAALAAITLSAVLLSSRGGTTPPATPLGNQPLFR
jgi:tetratricopeptide (TPR) repeat protein